MILTKTKLRIFNTNVKSITLYVCEACGKLQFKLLINDNDLFHVKTNCG